MHVVIFLSYIVQVSVPLKACWGHSLTAVSLGPGLTEVVEFGGSPDPFTGSSETQPKMADTTLLHLYIATEHFCVYTPKLYLHESVTIFSVLLWLMCLIMM